MLQSEGIFGSAQDTFRRGTGQLGRGLHSMSATASAPTSFSARQESDQAPIVSFPPSEIAISWSSTYPSSTYDR
jgi:hypothetical protein